MSARLARLRTVAQKYLGATHRGTECRTLSDGSFGFLVPLMVSIPADGADDMTLALSMIEAIEGMMKRARQHFCGAKKVMVADEFAIRGVGADDLKSLRPVGEPVIEKPDDGTIAVQEVATDSRRLLISTPSGLNPTYSAPCEGLKPTFVRRIDGRTKAGRRMKLVGAK